MESVQLQRASEIYASKLETIKESIFNDHSSLDWAEAQDLTVEKTALEPIEDVIDNHDFTHSAKLVELINEKSWLASGKVSDSIALDSYKSIVLRPVEFVPGSIKPFDEVKSDIKAIKQAEYTQAQRTEQVNQQYAKLLSHDIKIDQLREQDFTYDSYKHIKLNDIRPYAKLWVPTLLSLPVYENAYEIVDTMDGPAIMVLKSYYTKEGDDNEDVLLPWQGSIFSSLTKSLLSRAKYDKPPSLK